MTHVAARAVTLIRLQVLERNIVRKEKIFSFRGYDVAHWVRANLNLSDTVDALSLSDQTNIHDVSFYRGRLVSAAILRSRFVWKNLHHEQEFVWRKCVADERSHGEANISDWILWNRQDNMVSDVLLSEGNSNFDSISDDFDYRARQSFQWHGSIALDLWYIQMVRRSNCFLTFASRFAHRVHSSIVTFRATTGQLGGKLHVPLFALKQFARLCIQSVSNTESTKLGRCGFSSS